MIISSKNIEIQHPILDIIAEANKNSKTPERHSSGIYITGHFNGPEAFGSKSEERYEKYPENLSVFCYGVCDSPEQLLEACPELLLPGREFVVTVTPIEKANQPEEGGWRWHKWGPYIGAQTQTCEYLYDEPLIEKVYCYHIYEKK